MGEPVSSDHHADDRLNCPSCLVPWPCRMYLEARKVTPPRKLIVLKRERPMPNGETLIGRLR
jgi:hypothetical protein